MNEIGGFVAFMVFVGGISFIVGLYGRDKYQHGYSNALEEFEPRLDAMMDSLRQVNQTIQRWEKEALRLRSQRDGLFEACKIFASAVTQEDREEAWQVARKTIVDNPPQEGV